MKTLSPEQQEAALREALNELRWYGHQIAGGAPMVGYALVARQAEKHWYDFTLPFLTELDAVYANKPPAPEAEKER